MPRIFQHGTFITGQLARRPRLSFSIDQITLLPLDLWGAEHAFEVFDRPVAGVARAMIGPIHLGSDTRGLEVDIRCLAVTEDYEYIALLEDITYIATEEGRLFLVVLLDLYSRPVVGWSMKDANRIN